MNEEFEKLYNVVSQAGLYTKSFDEFSAKYGNDKEAQSKLFSVVSQAKLYTKTQEEFNSKYFGQVKPTEPVKKKETATESQSASANGNSSSGSKEVQPIENTQNQQNPGGAVVLDEAQIDYRYDPETDSFVSLSGSSENLTLTELKNHQSKLKRDREIYEKEVESINSISYLNHNDDQELDRRIKSYMIESGRDALNEEEVNLAKLEYKNKIANLQTEEEKKMGYDSMRDPLGNVQNRELLSALDTSRQSTRPEDSNIIRSMRSAGITDEQLSAVDLPEFAKFLKDNGYETQFMRKSFIGQDRMVDEESESLGLIAMFSQYQREKLERDMNILSARLETWEMDPETHNANVELYQQKYDEYVQTGKSFQENVVPKFEVYAKEVAEKKENAEDYQRAINATWGERTASQWGTLWGATAANTFNKVKDIPYSLATGFISGLGSIEDAINSENINPNSPEFNQSERGKVLQDLSDYITDYTTKNFGIDTYDQTHFAGKTTIYEDPMGNKITKRSDGYYYDKNNRIVEIRDTNSLTKIKDETEYDWFALNSLGAEQAALMATAFSTGGTAGVPVVYSAVSYKENLDMYRQAFPDASPAESLAYATALSGVEGLSHLILPENKLFNSHLSSKLLNALKGVDSKTRAEAVRDGFGGFLNVILKENLEEWIPEVNRMVTNVVANSANGVKKLDEEITIETMIDITALTTIVSGVAGVRQQVGQAKASMGIMSYEDAIFRLAQNPELAQGTLNTFKDPTIIEHLGQERIEQIKNDLHKTIIDTQKLPKGTTKEQYDKVAPLLEEKAELREQMKNADDAFKGHYQTLIEGINQDITKAYNKPETKQKKTSKADSKIIIETTDEEDETPKETPTATQAETDVETTQETPTQPQSEPNLFTEPEQTAERSELSQQAISRVQDGETTIEDEISDQEERLARYRENFGESSPQFQNQQKVVDELVEYRDSGVQASNENLEVRLVDGKPVVTNKTGGNISEQNKRRAVKDAAEKGLFDGMPNALTEDVQLNSDEEVSRYVAENSENPVEVAQEVENITARNQENERQVGFEDFVVPHIRQGVNEESFAGNSDRNNITPSIRRSYLKKNGGRSLDVIAQEVEIEMYGDYNANAPRITEQMIVDFMLENPSISEFESSRKSNEQIALEEKFTALTGLPATKQNIELFSNRAKQGTETEASTETEQSQEPVAEVVEEEDFPFHISKKKDTKDFETSDKTKATAEKLRKKYPDVVVVQNESELPEVIQNEIRRQRADGTVRGVYYRGEVYMVADNIPTMGEAEGTYRHETIGHVAVRNYLGQRLAEFAVRLVERSKGAQRKKIQEIAKRYGFSEDLDSLTLAETMELGEEYIAFVAENKTRYPNAWQEIVRFVRQALRDFGVKLRFTDKEIEFIISKAAEARRKSFESGQTRFQVSAFHGSPHTVDRFSTDYIGTGEGAQRFGWGLYFTYLEDIGRSYAKKLGYGKDTSIRVFDAYNYYTDNEWALPYLKEDIDNIEKDGFISLGGERYDKKTLSEKEKSDLKQIYIDLVQGNFDRNVYSVTLHKGKQPSEYTWLEWDKPFTSKQKQNILSLLDKEGRKDTFEYKEVESATDDSFDSEGREIYRLLSNRLGSDKEASLFLLRAGIDGIKYPAESISRGATSDNARGFNYVVFDENAITIEESIRFQRRSISEIVGDKFSGRDLTLGLKEKGREALKEKRETWKRWAKRGFNKTFKSGGGLPLKFSETIKDLTRQDAEILDSLNTEIGQFRDVLKSIKGTDKQKTAKYAAINRYLAGDTFEDISFLTPEQIKDIDYFRNRIDQVSDKVIGVLNKKKSHFDSQLSSLEGTPTMDSIKTILDNEKLSTGEKQSQIMNLLIESGSKPQTAMANTARLIARNGVENLIRTIENNRGKYLTRSYEAFNNKKYIERFNKPYNKLSPKSKRLFDNVVNFLIREEGMTKEEATTWLKNYIDDIRKSQDVGDFVTKSTGRAKADFLKKRKNLPIEFRELLGESKEPLYNYANTLYEMSSFLANISYQEKMRDLLISSGIGKYTTEEGRDVDYTAVASNAPEWSTLHGIYVPLWFKEGMDDMSELNPVESGAYKAYIKLTGWTKVGKTIWSPTTTMRNLMSGVLLGLNAGHSFILHPKYTAQAFNHAFKTGMSAQKMKEERQKLITLGILNDGVNYGELKATLTDFRKQLDSMVKPKALDKAIDYTGRLYAFGDDFYKVVGFYVERDRFMKSGMTEAEAELKAAERTRGGYPTYSYLPKTFKALRRFPLMATFVSFPYEVVRTTKNNATYVVEDLRAGRNEMAAKRALGMLIANALPSMIIPLVSALNGIGDDEEEAIRLTLPEYQTNSQILFYKGEKGETRFVDLTALVPSEVFVKPFATAFGARKDYDSALQQLTEGTKEMVSPYTSADVTTKTIQELFSNKDGFGREIHSGKGVWDLDFYRAKNAWDIGHHYLKQAGPGIYNNVVEFGRANDILPEMIGNKNTDYGREFTNETAIMAVLGLRATDVNMKAAITSYGFKLKDERDKISSVAREKANVGKVLSDKRVEKIVSGMSKDNAKLFSDAQKVIDAGRKLGLSQRDLYIELKELSTNFSKTDMTLLLNGGTLPLRPIGEQAYGKSILRKDHLNSDDPVRSGEMKEKYTENVIKINTQIAEENKKIMQKNMKIFGNKK